MDNLLAFVEARVPLELVQRVTDQFLKTAPRGEEVDRALRLHFRDTVNNKIDDSALVIKHLRESYATVQLSIEHLRRHYTPNAGMWGRAKKSLKTDAGGGGAAHPKRRARSGVRGGAQAKQLAARRAHDADLKFLDTELAKMENGERDQGVVRKEGDAKCDHVHEVNALTKAAQVGTSAIAARVRTTLP